MGVGAARQDEGPALPHRLRWIVVRGLAAVVTGVVVLGVGSRLVMLASRLLHPDTVGRVTENGNRIGDFTVAGTVALLVFVGLFGGITAGIVWVVLHRWLPRRAGIVAVAAVAIGGSRAVNAENRDFMILDPPLVDVLLLLGMVALFGAALPAVDRWLDARLPPPTTGVRTALYTVPVVLVSPLVIPLTGGFFTQRFCVCDDPPILTGVALVAAAVATVWWWIAARRGADAPSAWNARVGQASAALAVLFGAADILGEVTDVL